jgi:hypothetical protein
VKSLGVDQLTVGNEIAPGVPWVGAMSKGRPLSLALKSGNFSGPRFFIDAWADDGEDIRRDEDWRGDRRCGQVALRPGLTAGSTGDIRVRLLDGLMLMTPSSRRAQMLVGITVLIVFRLIGEMLGYFPRQPYNA